MDHIFKRHLSKNSASCQNAFLRWKFANAKSLYAQDLKAHYGCVNAIEFSNECGEYMASGGDDKRILLWNVEQVIEGQCIPKEMKGRHHSNIFCIGFNKSNTVIFSGGNDEQVISHDTVTGETLDVFGHEEAVYGISIDPMNDNMFASACDDGRILIHDVRSNSNDSFVLASYATPMHSVAYNPVEARLLVSANSKEGIALWDVRKPKIPVMRYGGEIESCMSVRVNSRGDQLIALRRRLPPVLYDIRIKTALLQFDHVGYYNSCTMKSCCFAGDNDQYLVSGSDDFNLYLWRIPEDPFEESWINEAQIILRGHRSIANQVRFNPSNHLLISSGVEKVIKMWSPFSFPRKSEQHSSYVFIDRSIYTHEEYISLLIRNGMTHDYTHQSIDEDPRMIAFFDSLVQRELEGWESDNSIDTSSESSLIVQLSVSSSSSESNSDNEVIDVSPFTIAFASAMVNQQDRNDNAGVLNQMLNLEETEIPLLSENIQPLDNTTSNSLPGQTPNSQRKSISDLIQQKRKEYISSIKNPDTHKKKRKGKFHRNLCKDVISNPNSENSKESYSVSVKTSASKSGIEQNISIVYDNDNLSESESEMYDLPAEVLSKKSPSNDRISKFLKLKKDCEKEDLQCSTFSEIKGCSLHSYNNSIPSTSQNCSNSQSNLEDESAAFISKESQNYFKPSNGHEEGPYVSPLDCLSNHLLYEEPFVSTSLSLVNHMSSKEPFVSTSGSLANHMSYKEPFVSTSDSLPNHMSCKEPFVSTSDCMTNHMSCKEPFVSTSDSLANHMSFKEPFASPSDSLANHMSCKEPFVSTLDSTTNHMSYKEPFVSTSDSMTNHMSRGGPFFSTSDSITNHMSRGGPFFSTSDSITNDTSCGRPFFSTSVGMTNHTSHGDLFVSTSDSMNTHTSCGGPFVSTSNNMTNHMPCGGPNLSISEDIPDHFSQDFTNSDNGSQNVENSDNQPTLTKFKHYIKRIRKARQYYRRQSQNTSSGEDE